ncbi:MAG: hypothetical protein LC714_09735 [Actinobacteria bacterium]|nr:hypothetical protein [Actinomycetota bacterium]
MILESVVATDIESADLRMAAILKDVTSAGAGVPDGNLRGSTLSGYRRRVGRILPSGKEGLAGRSTLGGATWGGE